MTYYITLSSDEKHIPLELVLMIAEKLREICQLFQNVDIKIQVNDYVEIKNILEESEK